VLRVVDEEVCRIVFYIVLIVVVIDVGFVVLGGGIGMNGGDFFYDCICM